jgi:tetratricopeptide (TPR) repeat protein
MKRRAMPFILGLAALLAATTSLRAADTIKKLSGGTVNGTIKSIGKTEVVIDKTAGAADTIPVNDIDVIFFDGEPPAMKSVRSSTASGAYTYALSTLEKIDSSTLTRPEVQQDVHFYRALCHARMALASNTKLQDAGTEMLAFVNANPSSFHALAANELVGDLLMALDKPELAQKYYAEVAAAPFPDLKMKAGILNGRALVAQKKYPEAEKAFADVIQLASQQKSPAGENEKVIATLGNADCLANEGKVDEAIKQVQAVIKGLDPENEPLQADAFLTLGNCYLKQPSAKKDALLAFLHVDIVYPSQTQAHIAALRHLAVLWNDLGKPDRSAAATETLKDLASGNANQ